MKYIVILGDGMADLPGKGKGIKLLWIVRSIRIWILLQRTVFVDWQKLCRKECPREVILQIFLQWDMIQKYITQDVLR